MADNNGVLDWDSTIEDDGSSQEFIVLPEGDYFFTVRSFERGRFPGGAKIPASPKAVIYMDIENDIGHADAKVDLILHRAVEWKLTAFFRCIGQKKHGEPLSMKWDQVTGSRGRAHFKPREYTKKDNTKGQVNDVDRFYDWDDKLMNTTPVKDDADNPWGGF